MNTTLRLKPRNENTKRWSDAVNPSVSSIFLWQGLGEEARASLAERRGGQIGLADWLTPFAAVCERMYDRLKDDLPGVYHYEIVEEMGAWLWEQNSPNLVSFTTELESRVTRWIKDCQPAVKV